MKDGNKNIMRLLLLVSGIVLLAQTVLLVTHYHGVMKLYMVPLITVGEIAIVALVAYCVLYPEMSRNYRLRRTDKGFNMERVQYAADPNGLRYISAGVAALAMTVLFVPIAVSMVWHGKIGDTFISIVAIVMVTVLLVAHCVVEYILRKQNKNNSTK